MFACASKPMEICPSIASYRLLRATGAPRRDHEQNGETMNQTDWVRPSWKTMLIGLALTAGGALSVPAAPATAPHGAMPMQEQQRGRAFGLREALKTARAPLRG